jgi:hypothetical protein
MKSAPRPKPISRSPKQASPSFFEKKEAKKLLLPGPMRVALTGPPAPGAKVFWLLFFKKVTSSFLPIPIRAIPDSKGILKRPRMNRSVLVRFAEFFIAAAVVSRVDMSVSALPSATKGTLRRRLSGARCRRGLGHASATCARDMPARSATSLPRRRASPECCRRMFILVLRSSMPPLADSDLSAHAFQREAAH